MVSYTNSSSSESQSQGIQLHRIQKPQSKKPTGPASGSSQPKVYNVKPIHFRELVQRLTGASQQPQQLPQAAPQRIQSAAPPPIQLSARPNMIFKSDHQRKPASDVFNLGDGTELSLSPSSYSWFSFPLLSPGPVSNFGV